MQVAVASVKMDLPPNGGPKFVPVFAEKRPHTHNQGLILGRVFRSHHLTATSLLDRNIRCETRVKDAVKQEKAKRWQRKRKDLLVDSLNKVLKEK